MMILLTSYRVNEQELALQLLERKELYPPDVYLRRLAWEVERGMILDGIEELSGALESRSLFRSNIF